MNFPAASSKKWRVGLKVPLNVYDGDRPVCQCHTAEDAALIVAAMGSNTQEAVDEFYLKAQAIIADRDRRLAEFRKLAQSMPHEEYCRVDWKCNEPGCAVCGVCNCLRAKFLAITTGGGE